MAELTNFDDRCELRKNNEAIFVGIFNETGGAPCKGCGYESSCTLRKEIGKTKKKLKFNDEPVKVKLTNAQIASKMDNITKRQVAKMRKAGTLPAEYM